MIENYSTVKNYVLTIGGYTDDLKLDLQIQMLIDEILAYCYRKDVPAEMELPLADVIVNELKRRSLLVGVDGNITSYREGDLSIGFGNSNISINGTSTKYDSKLERFKLILGAENV